MTPLITKGQRHFRFCTTPVFLDGQMGLLERWSALLSEALQAKVSFVQRRSYQAIVTLLKSKEADAAWLCGYPYVLNRDFLDLIAVPVYNGASLYQSYLVVNSSDKSTKTIKDLGQTVFAYSDPLSNSGFLVPRHILLTAGISPDQFFRKTFFTYSHQKLSRQFRNELQMQALWTAMSGKRSPSNTRQQCQGCELHGALSAMDSHPLLYVRDFLLTQRVG